MDKRARAQLFQERLTLALTERGMSQSTLARDAGIDRSTVSQLLSGATPRLPNSHALGEIAEVIGESADWLIGLTAQRGATADILDRTVQVAEAPRHPVDENILAWHREALGYKVRYVPASLPDLFKTEAVLRLEYGPGEGRSGDQAVADATAKLEHSRETEIDMEICMSLQALADFGAGSSLWGRLSSRERRRQFFHMADIADELYPRLRVYLFDLATHYSAPFAVFGPQRAVLYLGQRYLVFTASAHVRFFQGHFDGLVRAATIQADGFAAYVRSLGEVLPDNGK
ncbi:MAG: transcriptional regulator [Hyphomicrobiales bacterium]|nr:MAG: transcriptional regulator [Hyphomicrobiales bacterium]